MRCLLLCGVSYCVSFVVCWLLLICWCCLLFVVFVAVRRLLLLFAVAGGLVVVDICWCVLLLPLRLQGSLTTWLQGEHQLWRMMITSVESRR